ncbi:hypothetical protein M422DRAFT_69947 [Sphaerobolus stellatus SS14]|uniref:Uncharacterized protein n=1 Tax=Sphaerobolus stellatus (strain SS14) TaxID=990650 RepID=A0A0C9VCW2_SPHS4|nr:hypothetical protein M422DRAFT_69947 [Sphaerobolus stellatus SS14]
MGQNSKGSPRKRRKAVTSDQSNKKAKVDGSEGGKRKPGRQPKAASSSTTSPKSSKDTTKPDVGEGAGNRVQIDWTNEPTLTWKLISTIEDNDAYRQAFGFVNGSTVSVNSNGKTIIDQCRSIAATVLAADESEWWKDTDLKKLGEAVKNRVNNIKKKYTLNRNRIHETGQGLIDEGREDQIEEGSPLENLWQQILRDFPYYQRMNALMGKSPVIGAASQNSASTLDLSVLRTEQAGHGVGVTAVGKMMDNEVTGRSSIAPSVGNGSDVSDIDSHSGSPHLDSPQSLLSEAAMMPANIKNMQPSTAVATKASETMKITQEGSVNTSNVKPKNAKRDLMDKARDILDEQREMHERVAAENLRARVGREKEKQRMQLELRRMELQAEKENREAQRAHELELKRMELEALRLQYSSHSSNVSSSPHPGYNSVFGSFTSSSEQENMLDSTLYENLESGFVPDILVIPT